MPLLLLLLPFNSLYSKTTWVSRHQKGKTSLDLNEARDGGVLGWQWHQLDRMQTICTSLQTDNHNTSSLNFYRLDALPGRPSQQCQSTFMRSEVFAKLKASLNLILALNKMPKVWELQSRAPVLFKSTKIELIALKNNYKRQTERERIKPEYLMGCMFPA